MRRGRELQIGGAEKRKARDPNDRLCICVLKRSIMHCHDVTLICQENSEPLIGAKRGTRCSSRKRRLKIRCNSKFTAEPSTATQNTATSNR